MLCGGLENTNCMICIIMELQDVLIYAVLWFGKLKLLDSYVEYSVTLSDEWVNDHGNFVI